MVVTIFVVGVSAAHANSWKDLLMPIFLAVFMGAVTRNIWISSKQGRYDEQKTLSPSKQMSKDMHGPMKYLFLGIIGFIIFVYLQVQVTSS